MAFQRGKGIDRKQKKFGFLENNYYLCITRNKEGQGKIKQLGNRKKTFGYLKYFSYLCIVAQKNV